MAGFGKYIYIAGTELAGQSQGFYDHTSCNTLERVITCITCITVREGNCRRGCFVGVNVAYNDPLVRG